MIKIPSRANRAKGLVRWPRSATPAVRPDLLADHAVHTRLLVLLRNAHHGALRHTARNLHQELGADGFLELVAVLDRDDEGTGTADDAIFIVEVEVVDIHGRIGRLLDHDRQAVDDDALLDRRVARDRDRSAIVVGTV